MVVWGSGKALREFLLVDDMAAASLFVMNLDADTKPMLSHINVGTGADVTIRELAETVAQLTGFKGRLSFDASRPDGTPRKLMDVSRLARGQGPAGKPARPDEVAGFRSAGRACLFVFPSPQRALPFHKLV